MRHTFPLKAKTSPLSVVMASSLQTIDVLGTGVVDDAVGAAGAGLVGGLFEPNQHEFLVTSGSI